MEEHEHGLREEDMVVEEEEEEEEEEEMEPQFKREELIERYHVSPEYIGQLLDQRLMG